MRIGCACCHPLPTNQNILSMKFIFLPWLLLAFFFFPLTYGENYRGSRKDLKKGNGETGANLARIYLRRTRIIQYISTSRLYRTASLGRLGHSIMSPEQRSKKCPQAFSVPDPCLELGKRIKTARIGEGGA